MTPTNPPSAPEQCQEAEAKPCCKCAAYREINANQAQEIARLTNALISVRERSQYSINEVDRTIGKGL